MPRKVPFKKVSVEEIKNSNAHLSNDEIIVASSSIDSISNVINNNADNNIDTFINDNVSNGTIDNALQSNDNNSIADVIIDISSNDNVSIDTINNALNNIDNKNNADDNIDITSIDNVSIAPKINKIMFSHVRSHFYKLLGDNDKIEVKCQEIIIELGINAHTFYKYLKILKETDFVITKMRYGTVIARR